MSSFRDRIRAAASAITDGMTTAVTGGGPRVSGPPRSPNGASSFHLTWEMPRAARLVEVSAALEVLVPPRVSSLYFWALQVDFEEDGLIWGGGHTGLQWNRRFSGSKAVNWGGYAAQERGGAVLPGSEPVLPAFPGDPNTMAYGWKAGRIYRLRVYHSPDDFGAWRAEIEDLQSGEATVLRDLMHPGRPSRPAGASGHRGYLRRPVVWSEVFADCDAPSVVVRWSRLSGRTEDGKAVIPEAVRVNYQAHQAGGCANTSVRMDETGFLQLTNTVRDVGQGMSLEFRRD